MLDFEDLEAAEGTKEQDEVVVFPGGPRPYLVIHPHVVVRSAPHIPQGRGTGLQDAVSIRISGQVVLAEASKNSWLRLARVDELLFNDGAAEQLEAEGAGIRDAVMPGSLHRGLLPGTSWILADGDAAGLPGVPLLKPLPGPPRPLPGAAPPELVAACARAAFRQRLEARARFSFRAASTCCLRRRPGVMAAAAEWIWWAGGAPEMQPGGASSPACCSALGSGARVEARRAVGDRKRGAILPPWRVYAAQDFEAGEEVECCPLLELPQGVDPAVFPGVRLVPLRNEANGGMGYALMLGFGSLYRAPVGLQGNLSFMIIDEPCGLQLKAIRLTARHPIRIGEELLLALEGFEDLRGMPAVRALSAMVPPFKLGTSLPSTHGRSLGASEGEEPADAGAFGGSVLRPSVCVAPSTKVPDGRGVFAKRHFRSGEVIELCPCLVLIDPEANLALKDYIMEGPRLNQAPSSSARGSGARSKASGRNGQPRQLHGKGEGEAEQAVQASVLALGSGCLYNHGQPSELNARWALARDLEMVVLQAQHDIQEGAEVFISYTDKWWQRRGIAPL